MIKGKTKSGFSYELDKERLNNYELLEAIEELEENPLVLSRVVNLLLGKEQTNSTLFEKGIVCKSHRSLAGRRMKSSVPQSLLRMSEFVPMSNSSS